MASDEEAGERAERLRQEGVILCGPTPTADDLDAVEAFRDQLRQAPVTVWPMEEAGPVIKVETVDEARDAYRQWLVREDDTFDGLDALVDGAEYRAGWYRWTPCSERSCFDGGQHRPGHLQDATGPGRGAWRGVWVNP
jgi:hypothetical protein